jgi:hypothetical protein
VTFTEPSGWTAAWALPMARSSTLVGEPGCWSTNRAPAGWAGSQPLPRATTVSKE